MNKNIYIIVGSVGSYDDIHTWTVSAFLDNETCLKILKELEQCVINNDWEGLKKLDKGILLDSYFERIFDLDDFSYDMQEIPIYEENKEENKLTPNDILKATLVGKTIKSLSFDPTLTLHMGKTVTDVLISSQGILIYFSPDDFIFVYHDELITF